MSGFQRTPQGTETEVGRGKGTGKQRFQYWGRTAIAVGSLAYSVRSPASKGRERETETVRDRETERYDRQASRWCSYHGHPSTWASFLVISIQMKVARAREEMNVGKRDQQK